MVKNPPAKAGGAGVVGSISGWEDPLEKEMATHSSILGLPWLAQSIKNLPAMWETQV